MVAFTISGSPLRQGQAPPLGPFYPPHPPLPAPLMRPMTASQREALWEDDFTMIQAKPDDSHLTCQWWVRCTALQSIAASQNGPWSETQLYTILVGGGRLERFVSEDKQCLKGWSDHPVDTEDGRTENGGRQV